MIDGWWIVSLQKYAFQCCHYSSQPIELINPFPYESVSKTFTFSTNFDLSRMLWSSHSRFKGAPSSDPAYRRPSSDRCPRYPLERFLLHSQNFRKKTRKKTQRFAGKKTAVVISFESQNWVLKDLVVKLCSGPILPSLQKNTPDQAGENNLPVGFWKKTAKKKHHTCTMSLLIKCSPSHHQQCKGKSNFGAPACLNLYLRRVARHGSGRKGQTQTKTLL